MKILKTLLKLGLCQKFFHACFQKNEKKHGKIVNYSFFLLHMRFYLKLLFRHFLTLVYMRLF